MISKVMYLLILFMFFGCKPKKELKQNSSKVESIEFSESPFLNLDMSKYHSCFETESPWRMNYTVPEVAKKGVKYKDVLREFLFELYVARIFVLKFGIYDIGDGSFFTPKNLNVKRSELENLIPKSCTKKNNFLENIFYNGSYSTKPIDANSIVNSTIDKLLDQDNVHKYAWPSVFKPNQACRKENRKSILENLYQKNQLTQSMIRKSAIYKTQEILEKLCEDGKFVDQFIPYRTKWEIDQKIPYFDANAISLILHNSKFSGNWDNSKKSKKRSGETIENMCQEKGNANEIHPTAMQYQESKLKELKCTYCDGLRARQYSRKSNKAFEQVVNFAIPITAGIIFSKIPGPCLINGAAASAASAYLTSLVYSYNYKMAQEEIKLQEKL